MWKPVLGLKLEPNAFDGGVQFVVRWSTRKQTKKIQPIAWSPGNQRNNTVDKYLLLYAIPNSVSNWTPCYRQKCVRCGACRHTTAMRCSDLTRSILVNETVGWLNSIVIFLRSSVDMLSLVMAGSGDIPIRHLRMTQSQEDSGTSIMVVYCITLRCMRSWYLTGGSWFGYLLLS